MAPLEPGHAIESVLAWALTYAVHSTVLVGGAWLFLRLRPRIAHAVRDGIWKAALLGGLLTASLQVGVGVRPVLGGWTLSERPTDARVEAVGQGEPNGDALAPVVVEPAPADLIEPAPPPDPEAHRGRTARPVVPRSGEPTGDETGPAAPAFPEHHVRATSPLRWTPEASRRDDAEPPRERAEPRLLAAARPDAGPPPPAPRRATAGRTALALVWAGGATLGSLFVVLALGRLRRHLAHRRPLETGPVAELLAGLARRAGVRRSVRLSTCRELASPITFGLVRAEICLPERALTELDPEQQEAMLAHELAHAVRRDPAWRVLAHLMEAVLFFQPLNRVARRHLLETAEYLCDDWAVAQTANELSLASCLTEIAGWVVGRERALLAPGMASGSRLGRRVHRLLARSGRRGARPTTGRAGAALALAGLVAVTGLVPGVSARSRQAAPLPGPAPRTAGAPSAPESIEPSARPSSPGVAAAVRATLAALDVQIAELEGEVRSLRERLLALPDGDALLPSVETVEHRITRLRARRAELARALPTLVERLVATRDDRAAGAPHPENRRPRR